MVAVAKVVECGFDTCFAVSDQQVVIPLKVVDCIERGDIKKITTEIVGDACQHAIDHHDVYFKEMWINNQGELTKKNVFMTKELALSGAISAAEDNLQLAERKVEGIKENIERLKQMLDGLEK